MRSLRASKLSTGAVDNFCNGKAKTPFLPYGGAPHPVEINIRTIISI